MRRWVRIDRRYNQPYRLTSYASRAIFKWTGLTWRRCSSTPRWPRVTWADWTWPPRVASIWYRVHCARRNRAPQLTGPTYRPAVSAASQEQFNAPVGQWQFNAPPHGPRPRLAGRRNRDGSLTRLGRRPTRMAVVGPATPSPRGAAGERNSRVIPQDVKIAVSVRDQGKSRQCAH